MKKNEVLTGDQFVQLGDTRVLWEVADCFDLPNLPTHAHLKEFSGKRVQTLSVSALLDKTLFMRTKVEKKEQVLTETLDNTPARINSLFGQHG